MVNDMMENTDYWLIIDGGWWLIMVYHNILSHFFWLHREGIQWGGSWVGHAKKGLETQHLGISPARREVAAAKQGSKRKYMKYPSSTNINQFINTH